MKKMSHHERECDARLTRGQFGSFSRGPGLAGLPHIFRQKFNSSLVKSKSVTEKTDVVPFPCELERWGFEQTNGGYGVPNIDSFQNK